MEFSCADALPGCTVKSTRTLGEIQLTPVEISTAKSKGGMKSKEIRGGWEKIKVILSLRQGNNCRMHQALNHCLFLFRIWKSWLVWRTSGEIQHSNTKGHSPKHNLSPPTCGCLSLVQGSTHRRHSLAWPYIWTLCAGSLDLVHWPGKESLSLCRQTATHYGQSNPQLVDLWAKTQPCLTVQELLPFCWSRPEYLVQFLVQK